MTDAPTPFEAMLKAGQDFLKQANPALEQFTPEGLEKMWPTMSTEAMEAMMGKGANPEGLDAKTRLLLTLMGLTIMGAQAEAQVRMTVRHAEAAGATKQEIADTITQAGLFGGMPAMAKAMELATAALDEGEEE